MIAIESTVFAIGAPFVLVLGLRKLFIATATQGIIKPFLRGAATAFVALLIETFVWEYFQTSVSGDYALAVKMFLFVALPEELVKTALIYMVVVDFYELKFAETGILAAATGGGFAAAENLSYISQFGEAVIIPRLLTATPFHVFVAIVVAKVIFLGASQKRSEYLGGALVMATVLHGTYDYLIMSDQEANGKFLFALAFTSSLAINLLRHDKDHKSAGSES